jgi:hypothetical protein
VQELIDLLLKVIGKVKINKGLEMKAEFPDQE